MLRYRDKQAYQIDECASIYEGKEYLGVLRWKKLPEKGSEMQDLKRSSYSYGIAMTLQGEEGRVQLNPMCDFFFL